MAKSLRFQLVLALVALSISSSAQASTFNVNPIKLHLSSSAKSALLSVRNTSSEVLRFQITAYEWNQRENGEVELKPTKDLVYFPRMMKLEPGAQRKVRLGMARKAARKDNAKAEQGERTYRIIVEELPSRRSKKAANQLQILTRMSIPVFEAPPKVVETSTVAGAQAEAGKFSFDVQNNGTVHTMLKAVSVSALGNNDQELFNRELSGWYVLAGGKRTYQVELPTNVCDRIKSIVVRGQTLTSALSHKYQVPVGACVAR